MSITRLQTILDLRLSLAQRSKPMLAYLILDLRLMDYSTVCHQLLTLVINLELAR